ASAGTALNSRRRVSTDPYFVSVAGPPIPGRVAYATFSAIDARTGKAVWEKENPSASVSRNGVLSTSSGVLFRAAGDGNVIAYDASTGSTLWQFHIGVPGGGGPIASYLLAGEQYLAVSAGRRVWAFKLNGTIPAVEVQTSRAPNPAPAEIGFIGI